MRMRISFATRPIVVNYSSLVPAIGGLHNTLKACMLRSALCDSIVPPFCPSPCVHQYACLIVTSVDSDKNNTNTNGNHKCKDISYWKLIHSANHLERRRPYCVRFSPKTLGTNEPPAQKYVLSIIFRSQSLALV
jgi:hypothetical protein